MQIAFLKKRGGLLRDIEWPQAERILASHRGIAGCLRPQKTSLSAHHQRYATTKLPAEIQFIEDNDSHLDQQPLMWTLLFKWVECKLPRHQGSLRALQQHVQDHFSMLPTFELLIYRAEEPPAVGLTKSIVQAFSRINFHHPASCVLFGAKMQKGRKWSPFVISDIRSPETTRECFTVLGAKTAQVWNGGAFQIVALLDKADCQNCEHLCLTEVSLLPTHWPQRAYFTFSTINFNTPSFKQSSSGNLKPATYEGKAADVRRTEDPPSRSQCSNDERNTTASPQVVGPDLDKTLAVGLFPKPKEKMKVGNRPSLYSKRSSDTCLLLFPGPSVIYDNVSECFHVLKLLLCGDIESNPGPDDKVLTAIASLSAKVDSRHAELLAVLNQVQTNQSLLEQKVTDLSSRLATVETMVESYDSGHHIPDLPQAVNTVIRNETTALHSRLDELEDRSRRDNLIFFGIADNVSEGWAQSEKIITDLISQKLDLNLSNEAIQRAHRLGAYVPNKCRPIIVKFQSSKIKDNVFYQRKKFQPSKVSVSEDFSRATRQCRKKLHEFGKNSGQPYSLRVNKLYINKTVYVYCHVTDRVCELETREERNNSNIGNASPVTLPAAASLPAPAT
nr:uncharacterized protein LOC119175530 [Rhipicephalus microplus]